jgi:hypothetical protein
MARKKKLKSVKYITKVGNFTIQVVKVPVDIGFEVIAFVVRSGSRIVEETGKTKDDAVKRVKRTLNTKYVK